MKQSWCRTWYWLGLVPLLLSCRAVGEPAAAVPVITIPRQIERSVLTRPVTLPATVPEPPTPTQLLTFVTPAAPPEVVAASSAPPASLPGEQQQIVAVLQTQPAPVVRSPDIGTARPAASRDSVPTRPLVQPPLSPSPAEPTPDAPASPALPPAGEASLSPPVVWPATPVVYETSLTLNTYGYENGFISTAPDSPLYPYPELDFSRVTGPSPRSFRAVILENGYVSVTILPELGGRIYRWLDKSTGRQLLYNNPVVKPTHWGYRGWWLAAGGIEWAFPVGEHGLNEWRPWQYRLGADSVTVWDVDDRTGLEVGAVVRLDTAHAYLQITPYTRNDTPAAQPYQLWLNAMLSLAGNHISDQTRLILPPALVTVHSTGDPGLPGPGDQVSWPYYAGRDLSWPANWTGWLGFFAPSPGFTGIYDYAVDQGMVRTHTPGWPVGTKLFAPRGLDPAIWTDDTSDYLELWSGNVSTFGDQATLEPGQATGWTEYWYPVHGLGGLTFANTRGALRLDDSGALAELGLAAAAYTEGELQLFGSGQLVARWSVAIYPGQAWRTTWSRMPDITGPLGLRLVYPDDTIAVQVGAVP